MEKEIKEITFVLENCESITVPYQCFSNFEFTIDDMTKKHDRYIKTLNCVINDNGSIEYGMTYDGNMTSPIKRLSECEDICWVYIIYNDKSKEEHYVNWCDDDNENSNDNQTSRLIDYHTIEIKIAPYVPKCSLIDIFNFAIGTTFKGEKDKIFYTIEAQLKNKDNKYISSIIQLTEEQANQLYIKVS